MQQLGSKYLACRPPPPPDPRDQMVKIQLFQNMVLLHNKLKGMEHRAPSYHHIIIRFDTCGHVSCKRGGGM